MIKYFFIILLIFTFFGCSENPKEKLYGAWETVRCEHFVNDERKPRSEWPMRFQFSEDQYTELYPSPTTSEMMTYQDYEVDADSIYTTIDGIKSGIAYHFKNDTLVLTYDYEPYGLNEKYIFYLARMDYDNIYDWPKPEIELKGEWSRVEAYSCHKDSLDPLYKNQSIPSIDYVIGENKIEELNYPFFYKSICDYSLEQDSIKIKGLDFEKSKRYYIQNDTLVFISVFKPKADYVFVERFVYGDFDEGFLRFLRTNIVDPDWLLGNYIHRGPISDTPVSHLFHQDSLPVDTLKFAEYEYGPPSIQNISFNKDIITFYQNGKEYKCRIENYWSQRNGHPPASEFLELRYLQPSLKFSFLYTNI